MNAVYVGILQPGSTSRMRAEWLRRLTPAWTWEWVDTDSPMQQSARMWRALAFRYQVGNAVDRINSLVVSHLSNVKRDLIWVDKGVFLRQSTVSRMRALTRRFVHYTPDAAFYANRSRHFEGSLDRYDLAVTTKSFELEEYGRRIGSDRVALVTQGFDPEVHRSLVEDNLRRKEAVFVGLAEPERQHCVSTLLEAGVPVRLAGKGWGGFLRRWRGHPFLFFEGHEILGDAYARLLSSSWVGLGLLSKQIPELHTTRTFEIPACGTVLATEANSETRRLFRDDEALFFENYADLAAKLRSLFDGRGIGLLEKRAAAGTRRVQVDRRDYPGILGELIADSRLAL